MENQEPNIQPQVNIINRHFKVDYSKIKTLEDVIILLKAMDLSLYWYSEECPPQFKELFDKEFLVEVNQK